MLAVPVNLSRACHRHLVYCYLKIITIRSATRSFYFMPLKRRIIFTDLLPEKLYSDNFISMYCFLCSPVGPVLYSSKRYSEKGPSIRFL